MEQFKNVLGSLGTLKDLCGAWWWGENNDTSTSRVFRENKISTVLYSEQGQGARARFKKQKFGKAEVKREVQPNEAINGKGE